MTRTSKRATPRLRERCVAPLRRGSSSRAADDEPERADRTADSQEGQEPDGEPIRGGEPVAMSRGDEMNGVRGARRQSGNNAERDGTTKTLAQHVLAA